MDLSLVRRRQLRREQTDAEATLWRLLRGRRFVGFRFRRQHPVGPFILDFFCRAHNLAVELGGGQHYEDAAQAYDARRTSYLNQRGIRVLRFPTDLVFRQREDVLTSIALALGVPL
jgi:ATP-dependent helicase HrpA/adenine-specific DNA-methyltransferase